MDKNLPLPCNNDPQHLALHPDLDRRVTDVLAVGEDLRYRVGCDPQALGLEILNLLHGDVPATIDDSKQTQQSHLPQQPNEAEIEHAVVYARQMGKPHTMSVLGRVSRGHEEARLV